MLQVAVKSGPGLEIPTGNPDLVHRTILSLVADYMPSNQMDSNAFLTVDLKEIQILQRVQKLQTYFSDYRFQFIDQNLFTF